MVKNTVTYYDKQEKIYYSPGQATILLNETPVILEYDDTTDDGTSTKVKRQLYQYDSYKITTDIDIPILLGSNEKYLLGLIKTRLIEEITAYDVSDNVNLFYLQGNAMWLSDVKRTSLIKSTNIRKSQGAATTVLWDDNNNRYDIPVDMAISMLNTLEMYALDCYNQTAQHKKNVEELTTLEEALTYDYTTGYPKKLRLPEDLLNT